MIIYYVKPGSSAARAGLAGVGTDGQIGDVIVAVNGKRVTTFADLSLMLEQIGIGKEARLTILRDGTRDVKVQVQDID